VIPPTEAAAVAAVEAAVGRVAAAVAALAGAAPDLAGVRVVGASPRRTLPRPGRPLANPGATALRYERAAPARLVGWDVVVAVPGDPRAVAAAGVTLLDVLAWADLAAGPAVRVRPAVPGRALPGEAFGAGAGRGRDAPVDLPRPVDRRERAAAALGADARGRPRLYAALGIGP